MKNERILLADDFEPGLTAVAEGIEFYGKDGGHQVVGKATSVEEIEKLMQGGLKPTVALVDHRFPEIGDGSEAARIIKKYSPETFVISYSSESGLKWGQENWLKRMGLKQLTEALTNLQH